MFLDTCLVLGKKKTANRAVSRGFRPQVQSKVSKMVDKRQVSFLLYEKILGLSKFIYYPL